MKLKIKRYLKYNPTAFHKLTTFTSLLLILGVVLLMFYSTNNTKENNSLIKVIATTNFIIIGISLTLFLKRIFFPSKEEYQNYYIYSMSVTIILNFSALLLSSGVDGFFITFGYTLINILTAFNLFVLIDRKKLSNGKNPFLKYFN